MWKCPVGQFPDIQGQKVTPVLAKYRCDLNASAAKWGGGIGVGLI